MIAEWTREVFRVEKRFKWKAASLSFSAVDAALNVGVVGEAGVCQEGRYLERRL